MRWPLAYSLSSQTTHLPSWATYLVISGTAFWPWSSKVIGPTIELWSLTAASALDDRLAIRTDLLDGVEHQLHRGEGERAVGLGRLAVACLLVLLHEELPARQLLDRRALAERQRALGERAQPVDEGVGDDARGALEQRVDAEPVHLLANAYAERRQAAEIDHVRIERLGLGELGGEVLLVGGHPEGAEDLAAARAQLLAEVLVVALAVVGGVVDHHPGLVAEVGHQIGRDLVLIDHRAVDPVDLRVVVAVGDVGQHRAPDHDRQAEAMVGVDRGDRDRRAVVRDARHDLAIGARLGRRLHPGVRLALVVEHHHLVLVLGAFVLVAQLDGEVGGVAPAQAVGGDAAGERTDEHHLDQVLGIGGRCERERADGDAGDQAGPDVALQFSLPCLSPACAILCGCAARCKSPLPSHRA